MGVELRMTDKKRIGGSCDFLIKQKDGTVVLDGLSHPSPEDREQRQSRWTGMEAGNGAAGTTSVPDEQRVAQSYPKVMVDKCVTVVAGPGKTQTQSIDGRPERLLVSVGRRHVQIPGT